MSKSFGSVALNPGKTGTFFYNFAFRELNIDANYAAIKCVDLYEIQELLDQKLFHGLSVTMPFKQQVLKLCDTLDKSATLAQSANTLLLEGKSGYTGFSTDKTAVDVYLKKMTVGRTNIIGDGAMAIIFKNRIDNLGNDCTLFSRKFNNWEQRFNDCENLINCTHVGLDVNLLLFQKTSLKFVLDLVIQPKLVLPKKQHPFEYFTGIDFYQIVFMSQFKIYTNQEISRDLLSLITKMWEQEIV
jgi:shikimate 5-dehydrogenase